MLRAARQSPPARARWPLLILIPAALAASAPLRAQTPPDPAAPRLDLYGDPLPPGAIARMGTVRLREMGQVSQVAFSPDGRTLASAGATGGIRFWDVATGKLSGLLVRPGERNANVEWATSLVFSPDGRRIALGRGSSGAGQPAIQVWDIERRQLMADIEIRPLAPPSRDDLGVVQLAFLPGGRRLVGASADGAIRLWDAVTGDELLAREFANLRNSGGQLMISDLALSPDGRRAAVMNEQGRFAFWRVGAPGASPAVEAHIGYFGPSPQLAFSPGGERLFSVGVSRRDVMTDAGLTTRVRTSEVRVWDAATGERLDEFPLEVTGGNVQGLSIFPDGETLAVKFQGQPIILLNTRTGEEVRRFEGASETNGIQGDLAVSPDGRLLAMAGRRSTISLWDLEAGRRLYPPPGMPVEPPRAMTYSPDGLILATCSMDGTLYLWNAATGALIRAISTQDTELRLYSIAFSPDGVRVAAAGGSFADDPARGQVRVFAVDSGEEVARIDSPLEFQFMQVAYSPDGRFLATTYLADIFGFVFEAIDASPLLAELWNAETGKSVRQFRGIPGFADRLYIGFTSDGKSFLLKEASGVVRMWDLATGAARLRFDVGLERVRTAFALTPDGRYLAAAGTSAGKPTLTFWNLETGEPDIRASAPVSLVDGLHALSGGAEVVISSDSTDGLAVIWDANEERAVHRIEGVRGDHQTIALAPDERSVAVGIRDGTIVVYALPDRN